MAATDHLVSFEVGNGSGREGESGKEDGPAVVEDDLIP